MGHVALGCNMQFAAQRRLVIRCRTVGLQAFKPNRYGQKSEWTPLPILEGKNTACARYGKAGTVFGECHS